jgi:hypothetical protein
MAKTALNTGIVLMRYSIDKVKKKIKYFLTTSNRTLDGL